MPIDAVWNAAMRTYDELSAAQQADVSRLYANYKRGICDGLALEAACRDANITPDNGMAEAAEEYEEIMLLQDRFP